MTGAQLSGLADVSESVISKWKDGKQLPHSPELRRVAIALGREIDHFYMKKPPPPRPMEIVVPGWKAKRVAKVVDEDIEKWVLAQIAEGNRRQAERDRLRGPKKK